MKVRGFKTRVQLSEEQLEQVERKPGFSVTPVLAVVVWVASMLAATAIQWSWASFGADASGGEAEVQSSRAARAHAEVQSITASRAQPVDQEPTPDLDGEGQKVTSAPTAVATPPIPSAAGPTPAEPRDRKIRGSYAGARQDWLAGW